MKLKLLAQVVTDFTVSPEAPILDREKYGEFWNHVAADADELLDPPLASQAGADGRPDEFLRFNHRSERRDEGSRTTSGGLPAPYSRYRSLSTDSLELPLHVLELRLAARSFLERLPAETTTRRVAAKSGALFDSLHWRIFGFHVSLLEVDCRVTGWPTDARERQIRAFVDDLRDDGIALAECLAQDGYDHLLEPLFAELRARDPAGHYVRTGPGRPNLDRRRRVLWVARSLIFEPEDFGPGDGELRGALVRSWLRESLGVRARGTRLRKPAENEESRDDALEQIAADDREYLTRWLNYLFRERSYGSTDEADPNHSQSPRPAVGEPFCSAWKAMLHAQYFYGALDLIESRLTWILAQSFSDEEDLDLVAEKDRLERSIQEANLLLLQLQESKKYFERTVKAELDGILEFWDFENLLVEPVKEKIDLCRERLDLLLERQKDRAAVFTDSILLAIAILAVTSTALGLVDFGRTMANDADLARYDLQSRNFLDIFSSLPTDAVLLSSLAVSALMALFYLYFRTRQSS